MKPLLELIGETAPYVRAFDVTVKEDGAVLGWFKPEQQRYAETTLLSVSEALRSMALHGALIAAEANPVKARHYYLGSRAELQVFPVEATGLEAFQCEGRLVGIDHSDLGPIYRVKGSCRTDKGELYAELDGALLVLTEEEFVGLKGADVSPRPRWTPGQPSPYADPLRPMTLEWTEPGKMLRASLPGLPREDFAGHFDIRPLCPMSLIVANAASLLGRFPGYERFWIRHCSFSCRDVVDPGQAQRLICVSDKPGRFVVTVESDEGQRLGRFKFEAVPA
ncbi:hypothetical protein SAMN05443572_11395 [Myxococcus fulvus]|uniref:Uncharacterized protein n=1 Tax=Myxococcus fulvus TaxID=33 RepID=A0A511TFK1_MYXFU|nr:hypothetical protein [Myxococcus fulvus]GEN12941.1 hypothetical protein MFU01_79780 [Myxococcus fulvus]SEU38520.1 hypothetical protein SAMN05443572_11395 [Myxococcus fulvus]